MTENSTRSGIELSPVYGPTEPIGEYRERFGDPGEYPFTRGTRAYTGQGWIQRELSGEGDAGRSNEQFKYLMSLGQTGLDVIGDSPTMSLMDPDHPLARSTVGTQASRCAATTTTGSSSMPSRSTRCRSRVRAPRCSWWPASI